MASNQYAEQCNTKKEASQIADDLRQVKLFHLDITAADGWYWGYRGMDIEQLEYSESRIGSGVARALLEEADGFDEVSFGTGGRGWCFEIGDKYFWLATVRTCKHGNMTTYLHCPQCEDELDRLGGL
jgi:hypothetical protein